MGGKRDTDQPPCLLSTLLRGGGCRGKKDWALKSVVERRHVWWWTGLFVCLFVGWARVGSVCLYSWVVWTGGWVEEGPDPDPDPDPALTDRHPPKQNRTS